MSTERRAADPAQADSLVLNPDELGPDPVAGMDLAVELSIQYLEIRSADGANAVALPTERLRRIRVLAEERQLTVLSLASPLLKRCRPEDRPSGVDSFGFSTRVPTGDRRMSVECTLDAAEVLGAGIVPIVSHLLVEPELTEPFLSDSLIPEALAMASRRGVRLLLENGPVSTVASAQLLLEAMQRLHPMGLGLRLDLANLQQVERPLASPASIPGRPRQTRVPATRSTEVPRPTRLSEISPGRNMDLVPEYSNARGQGTGTSFHAHVGEPADHLRVQEYDHGDR